MSTAANTRLLKGTILKVDDLASGWITTGEIISIPMGFSSPSAEIPVSTAASEVDDFRVGLPDQGEATFEFFLDMDDAFEQEMEDMRDDQETRTFKLVLPEGTKDTGTFSAFVVDGRISGVHNGVYTYTLVLCVTSAVVWAAT